MAMRLDYQKIAPDAVGALAGLNKYSDGCSISPALRRLVEILVSQINGCTYCIHTHRRQALELGETVERIDALVHWQDAPSFSAAEKAAFAWSQTVTNIGTDGAPDSLFDELKEYYSDTEVIDLTFVTLSMNAWNRLAISFRHEAPGHD